MAVAIVALASLSAIFVAADGGARRNSPPGPDSWRGGYGNWSNPFKWTAGVPGTGSLNQNVVVATSNDQVNWDANTNIASFTVGTGTSDSIVNGTAGHSMNVRGPLTINSGAFTLNADTVTAAGDLTLVRGDLLVGEVSTVRINANGTSSAYLAVGGIGSQGDQVTVTGTWTITADGGIQLGGFDAITFGQLVNAGQVTLYCGGTLTVTGDVDNSGCMATSANGFCYAGATCLTRGGVLTGKRVRVRAANDSAIGSVVNVGGTLNNGPSSSFTLNMEDTANVARFLNDGSIYIATGQLNVGTLVAESGSHFGLEIDSPTAFGVTQVSGSVTLGGSLEADLNPDFKPSNGETFKFLLFPPGNLSGTFSSVNQGWRVVYDNADGYVELVAVGANVGP